MSVLLPTWELARAVTVFGGKSDTGASYLSSRKLAGAREKASRSLYSVEFKPTFLSS